MVYRSRESISEIEDHLLKMISREKMDKILTSRINNPCVPEFCIFQSYSSFKYDSNFVITILLNLMIKL